MTRYGWSVLLTGLILVSGCGWLEDADDSVSDDFPELSVLENGTRHDDESPDTSPKPPAPEEGRLELKLSVGDRFPLIKSVEQTLTQSSPNGPITSRSEVNLLMAITVEQVDSGRKRLGVHYQRVRYSHDIAGEKVFFDSSRPTSGPVPEIVQAYRGLVDNSFSFWIGADNRIIEVVGFPDFLRRCVRYVPLGQQQAMLARLAISEDSQGIANFVDDSIGLLPYNIAEDRQGSVVRVGDTWTKRVELLHPIPMMIATKYTLLSMNEREAHIDLLGTITPTTIATYDTLTSFSDGGRLEIRGGHSVGHCTIDRVTGLPLHSRIERTLDMAVRLSNGSTIEQSKSIITTIRAFPEQPKPQMTTTTPRNIPNRRDRHVIPAGAVSTDGITSRDSSRQQTIDR